MSVPLRAQDPLQAALAKGAFFPNSFLFYVDYSPFDFHYPDRKANQKIWHEYFHYLQCTTTTYGANVFLLESVIAEIVILFLQMLLNRQDRIPIPLCEYDRRPGKGELLEDFREVLQYIDTHENHLATLQGCCQWDETRNELFYRGVRLFNQSGCPTIDFRDQGANRFRVLGSTAIMEGAAALGEYAYLDFLRDREPETDGLKSAWAGTYRTSKHYNLTFEIFRSHLGIDIEEDSKLLAVADLALNPQLEIPPLMNFDHTQYPGCRFMRMLPILKGIPRLPYVNFHNEYKDLIAGICDRLGWKVPWESHPKYVMSGLEKFLAEKAHVLRCDLIGHKAALLNGFLLREQYPSRCPYPFPDFSAILRTQQRAAILMDETMLAHPPPFVRLQDGSVAFNKLAAEALGKHYRMTAGEMEPVARESFEKYFFVLRLSDLVWNGPSRAGSSVDCLQCDRNSTEPCGGRFLVDGSIKCQSCRCEKHFKEVLGRGPDEVRWEFPP